MKPLSSILEAIAKPFAHSVGSRVPRDRGRAGRAFLSILCLLATLFCLSVRAEEQLLWWLVNEDDPVEDWYGTASTISGIGATDVRLRVQDSSGNATYLNFYYWAEDEHGNVSQAVATGSLGLDVPFDAWADVSDYSGAEYSFVVELGNVVNGEWVKTLAATATPVPYNDLQSHIGSWSDIGSDLAHYWTPSGYSVPEPSSGLLMLIGGALLALRRRKGN